MDSLLAEYRDKYPPLITLPEGSVIARSPMGTMYEWSHQGLFDGFKIRAGRRVLLQRDAFIRFLLSRGECPEPSSEHDGK